MEASCYLLLNASYPESESKGKKRHINICGISPGSTDKLLHKKKLLLNSLWHLRNDWMLHIYWYNYSSHLSENIWMHLNHKYLRINHVDVAHIHHLKNTNLFCSKPYRNGQIFNGRITKLCANLNSGQQRFTDLGLQETFMLASQIKCCNEVKSLPQHNNNTSSNL